MLVPVEEASTPAPAPAKQRVRAPLKTIYDVKHELVKMYRESRAGKIDVSDASRWANILIMIARLIEQSDLEKRVEALENK